MKNKKIKGSITVEASIVFAMSSLILFMFLAPLFILKNSANIIIDLNEISKSAAIYKMLKYNFENDKGSVDVDNLKKEDVKNENSIEYIDEEITKDDLSESFENLTNIGIVIYKILQQNKNKNDAFSNISTVMPLNLETYDEKKQIINYKIKVDFKIPFNIFKINNLHQEFQIARRAFVGADGNRYEIDNDEEYIYVAESFKKSFVYHEKANCTMLKKITEEVLYKNIDTKENEYGEKYNKCEYCVKEKISSSTILFITQYGKLFHLNKDCPIMTAYVSKVSKEYIEKYNLRLCKICERKKDVDSTN